MPGIRMAVGVACVWLLVAAAGVTGAAGAAAGAGPAGAAAGGFAPMSDLIGFGSSGESFGEYPRTFPRLKELGVYPALQFNQRMISLMHGDSD
jgi:hypothetical protein